MPTLILLFLALVIVAYVGYTMYRSNAERRAIEKKRNQYHDRVLGVLCWLARLRLKKLSSVMILRTIERR